MLANLTLIPFTIIIRLPKMRSIFLGYLLMYHIYLIYDSDSSINSVLTLKACVCCLFYQCAMLSSPIITEKEWAVLAKMDQI